MTSQSLTKEHFYRTKFDRIENGKCGVAWLQMLRENAIDHYSAVGFPTVKNEDWKYTNVAAIAEKSFDLVSANEAFETEKLQPFFYDEARSSQLVFINGKLDSESSAIADLPPGVLIKSLAEAFGDETVCDLIKEHLARLVNYNSNGFTALNTAFLNDGAFVFVPKNTKIEAPIHLLFAATAESAAAFPRVLVILEQGAEATLVETYARTKEVEYLTNSVVEIVLADDARLTHYRVQRESHAAYHIGTTGVNLERSFYDSTNITLGAALSRHDVNVKFNSEGGEAFVDGLYLVSDTQHADTHSTIDHAVPNCASHQTYKGILDGKSRAVFNGKVFVRDGARGTDAQQSNKNLLLSNDARVDTKPQLEIFNDDVKCAHGATVGQLEDEEVFYLLSRGLSPELTRNLLTYGFAEGIVNKIEIESIKKQLDAAVLKRLEANF